MNDPTTFNFVRESDELVLPLVVSLAIVDAIADLRISCVEYTGSAVTSVNSSLTADIHIITNEHIELHGKLIIMNRDAMYICSIIINFTMYCLSIKLVNSIQWNP